MKFRKKPVEVEAIQLTEELALKCLTESLPGPFGLHISGSFHPGQGVVHHAHTTIETLEGVMHTNLGDWIIKGVAGELYPCKPDIFSQTYEPVESEAS